MIMLSVILLYMHCFNDIIFTILDEVINNRFF